MIWIKWIFGVLGALIIILVASAVGLYFAAAGDYVVPQTVTDDTSLPQVELGGVTFHAQTFGDPSDPTVLVIHGGPGGDYRYLLNLQELADTYHVVFYDQRGTGLSERLDASEYSIQANIDDIDLFVDHYGQGDPVHIIGHSWGAMIGAGYAGQNPDKVLGLVLAEPGALTGDALTRFIEAQQGSVSWGFLQSAVWAGFQGMHVDGPDADARWDYIVGTSAHAQLSQPGHPYICAGADYESAYWRWGTQAYRSTISISISADADMAPIRGGLSNITQEVLFMASACNEWIGALFQEETHMPLFDNARLVTIETAGHEMFTQSPEESIPPVREYLESASA